MQNRSKIPLPRGVQDTPAGVAACVKFRALDMYIDSMLQRRCQSQRLVWELSHQTIRMPHCASIGCPLEQGTQSGTNLFANHREASIWVRDHRGAPLLAALSESKGANLPCLTLFAAQHRAKPGRELDRYAAVGLLRACALIQSTILLVFLEMLHSFFRC
jgi:hypothetical protein